MNEKMIRPESGVRTVKAVVVHYSNETESIHGSSHDLAVLQGVASHLRKRAVDMFDEENTGVASERGQPVYLFELAEEMTTQPKTTRSQALVKLISDQWHE
jgi:hypothetical protein